MATQLDSTDRAYMEKYTFEEPSVPLPLDSHEPCVLYAAHYHWNENNMKQMTDRLAHNSGILELRCVYLLAASHEICVKV